ncbi:MAG: hypothetical protein QM820_27405 [Minicystis sp.]
MTGVSPLAAAGAALPFAQQAKQAPATPPAAKPAVAPVDPSLSGTVAGVISPFAAGATPLPFQPSAAAPARPAGPQASGGLPFQASASKRPSEAPPAGSPAARPSPSAADHAPAAAPAPATRLTLEQFASLTAEIAVSPQAAAQIRARYGFDEAGYRAEAEAHRQRFHADKALHNRYLELFQSYRDYVARSKR